MTSSSLKILVTGGAGYIGTHMVKSLLDAGHKPIILDNLSHGHSALIPGGEFIKGDIGDDTLLDNIFFENAIDAVMHFAAFIEVGESVKQPVRYYRNNFSGTAILLDCMIKHNVKRFIFSSSAAVYGEPVYTPMDELHPCVPQNPYGETKLWVERMLHACDEAHGLKYINLRYFNAAGADPSGSIGEYHIPESHLIPLVLAAALGKREDIKVFGSDYPTPDGTCIRDYIHVNDLAGAHLLALLHLMNNGQSATYNLGNSRGYSVKEVIDTVENVIQRKVKVSHAGPRPGDPAALIADSQKIRTEWGWRPVYEGLDQIIETAWKWHQKR